jgi:hypothetical protein
MLSPGCAGRDSERSAEFVPVNPVRCSLARARLGGAMQLDLLGPPGRRSGCRPHDGESKTHWIGDKAAYEKFRECEHDGRKRYEHDRAVNAAVFADEMSGSPASDL